MQARGEDTYTQETGVPPRPSLDPPPPSHTRTLPSSCASLLHIPRPPPSPLVHAGTHRRREPPPLTSPAPPPLMRAGAPVPGVCGARHAGRSAHLHLRRLGEAGGGAQRDPGRVGPSRDVQLLPGTWPLGGGDGFKVEGGLLGHCSPLLISPGDVQLLPGTWPFGGRGSLGSYDTRSPGGSP